MDLVPSGFRNLFAPNPETELPADALFMALGRVPVDGLAPALRARRLAIEEVGDCLSPCALGEATLEGTTEARHEVSF